MAFAEYLRGWGGMDKIQKKMARTPSIFVLQLRLPTGIARQAVILSNQEISDIPDSTDCLRLAYYCHESQSQMHAA
jgi:hypothetical protein